MSSIDAHKKNWITLCFELSTIIIITVIVSLVLFSYKATNSVQI